jgi:DNA-binding transcriptional LysR family regulator
VPTVEGQLEVAIYCILAEPTSGCMPLFREQFMIVMSPDHPRVAHLITARDLSGHRYLNRINCEFRYARPIWDGTAELRTVRSERDDWISP